MKPEAFYVLQRSSVPLPEIPLGTSFSPSPHNPPDIELARHSYEALQRALEGDRKLRAHQAETENRTASFKEFAIYCERSWLMPLDVAVMMFPIVQALYDRDHDYRNAEEVKIRERLIPAVERYLSDHASEPTWTPAVMYRLALLYEEKSTDEFLAAQEVFQAALDSANPPSGEVPMPDYKQSISLHRRLIAEFPNYKLRGAAHYLIGFLLTQMGQDDAAKRAFLEYLCPNGHAALSASSTDIYGQCLPLIQTDAYLAESWTRVAEVHFDRSELDAAISAYRRAMRSSKDGPYYDKALYKIAWSYYRSNKYAESVDAFDSLVIWSDSRVALGDQFGSDLRPEAIQYLGVCFAEPDWNDDKVPDRESALQRIRTFYRGRHTESHVPEVMKRVGDIHFDLTRYREAAEIYEALISGWEHHGDIPLIRSRLAESYKRLNNREKLRTTLEVQARAVMKTSQWYQRNRHNSEALARAEAMAKQALIALATNRHADAQVCKQRATRNKEEPLPDTCIGLYKSATQYYQEYFSVYPGSERETELLSYHADALYYSGQHVEAGEAYSRLRDSNSDRRIREDAALRAVLAFERALSSLAMKPDALALPDMPVAVPGKAPDLPMPIPPSVARVIASWDAYAKVIPYSPRSGELAFKAAMTALQFRHLDNARQRLEQIYDDYCRDPVSLRAARALALIHEIEGKGLTSTIWQERVTDGVCGTRSTK